MTALSSYELATQPFNGFSYSGTFARCHFAHRSEQIRIYRADEKPLTLSARWYVARRVLAAGMSPAFGRHDVQFRETRQEFPLQLTAPPLGRSSLGHYYR